MAKIIRSPAENDRIILKALQKSSMTHEEICLAVKMKPTTAGLAIARLRASKKSYIGGWKKVLGKTGKAAPVHFAGSEADVPYPVGQNTKPRVRKSQAKPKHSQEIEDDRWYPKRKCDQPPTIQRDWLVSAFFGEYQPPSTSNSNSSAEGWPQITLRVIGEYQGARA